MPFLFLQVLEFLVVRLLIFFYRLVFFFVRRKQLLNFQLLLSYHHIEN